MFLFILKSLVELKKKKQKTTKIVQHDFSSRMFVKIVSMARARG